MKKHKIQLTADSLIVLTNNYPFGKGEEFFETEIDYLAQKFKHIYIVSLSNNSQLTRTVPASVQVIRIGSYDNNKVIRFLVFGFYLLTNCRQIYRNILLKNQFLKTTYGLNLTEKRFMRFLTFSILGFFIEKQLNNLFEKKPEVKLYLYAYWNHAAAYAIALYKQKWPNVFAFSRAHGFDLYFHRSDCDYIPLRSFLADKLDAIFLGSKIGLDYYQKLLKQKHNNFFISRLGVKASPAQNRPSEDGVFRIVSCSNLIPLKRVDLIIQALALLEMPIEWTHIGDGCDAAKIHDMARLLLGNKANIRYSFTGYLKNPEVLAFYQKNPVDCFINVSTSEGVPVSMMEVLSCGIPIIATNVGGVSELVNEANGILLAPNPQPKDIAKTIQTLQALAAPKRNTYREQAYETWEKWFNAAKNYRLFGEKIFELGNLSCLCLQGFFVLNYLSYAF